MSVETLTGRVGSLTREQQEKLEEFKTQLLSINCYDSHLHDDHVLLRFLRARKFHLPEAQKMWVEKERWVKENNVENIIKTLDFAEYPIVKQCYPRFYHSTDKMGRPVYYELLGKLDVKTLFTVTTVERMMQQFIYEYEKLVHYRLVACSEKSNRHIEQSCTILDMSGIQISQFGSVFSVVKQVSTIAQNYYPEMLGRMFIINAPMLFTAIWTLVKPLLDEVTVKKISILGSSYKTQLLECIDASNLPKIYGGTCECPNGCEHSDVGPWSDGTVSGYPKAEFERFNLNFELKNTQQATSS